MNEKELEAELNVHEVVLRTLLTVWMHQQPAIATSFRDALEQLKSPNANHEAVAALARWTSFLKLPR